MVALERRPAESLVHLGGRSARRSSPRGPKLESAIDIGDRCFEAVHGDDYVTCDSPAA